MAQPGDTTTLATNQLVTDVLATIDREREREIVMRRFGLFDRKETLEQIGELLGITRERVRQLEKTIVIRLETNGDKLPHIADVQATIVNTLNQNGYVARVSKLASMLGINDNRLEQARLA